MSDRLDNTTAASEAAKWVEEANFTIPEGNLTALAEDDAGGLAIGIMSIIWTFWIVFTMFVPWPNSEHTGTYDAPIWYLWTLHGQNRIFYSWNPTAYLMAWILNIIVFFVEVFAWWSGGEFFVLWAHVGLWAGFVLNAFPWICELLYIYVEWPVRQTGSTWDYIFWSGEFIMLAGQGFFWIVSFIIHLIGVPSVVRMVAARKAIELGLVSECACDPCEVPNGDDEVARAQAEAICKAACEAKCPAESGAPPCPLRQFDDENMEDYARRCEAATQLAQVAAERENADIDEVESEDFGGNVNDAVDRVEDGLADVEPEDQPIDDVTSPEDEW